MREWWRGEGPFKARNPRLLVPFSALYHARAYYPVFAILFTDMGLSPEQFMLLNVVWAASILLLEVPSGAVADTFGRKRILIFSAVTMILEMGLLVAASLSGGTLLFVLCLINRFMSGLSEAASSGADEAIAYDSLPEEGREKAWDTVLVNAMRWRSTAFLLAMTTGSLMYDPSWWNWLAPQNLAVSTEVAHRLPLILVLLQGVACLFIALRFKEERKVSSVALMDRLRESTRMTLATARMAMSVRLIAVVLLGGMLLDAVSRNQATINSLVYRLIGLPDWVFGCMGSIIAVCNWFVPSLAAKANQRFSPVGSLLLGGLFALCALAMLVPAKIWLGIPAVMMLMMLLGYVNFTVGRFLHQQADSHQRATMLSVKGMAFNLGYGMYTGMFGMVLFIMPQGTSGERLQWALGWQVMGFAWLLMIFFLITRIVCGRKKELTDPSTP